MFRTFCSLGSSWSAAPGFLLCRCGLFSNGAPEFDARGQLKYSLHGMIANRPAHRLDVSVNPADREIVVTGVVRVKVADVKEGPE